MSRNPRLLEASEPPSDHPTTATPPHRRKESLQHLASSTTSGSSSRSCASPIPSEAALPMSCSELAAGEAIAESGECFPELGPAWASLGVL